MSWDCALQAGPAQALAAQHPGRAFAVQAALENEASVQAAVASAVAQLGPINVLVVNHGIWPPEDVLVKARCRQTLEHMGQGVMLSALARVCEC